jgi:ATP adenylyltransferase
MQTIFTPWRFSYISMNIQEEGCFFCQAASSQDQADSLVVWKGDHFLVMLNRYPYTNGHLMVAPLDHIADPQLSGPEAQLEFWPLVLKCQDALTAVYSPHGFNMGLNLGSAGGAGIPAHYHFHVVPRWEGDTNFMTVLGDVRLVPEESAQVVEKLRPRFAKE